LASRGSRARSDTFVIVRLVSSVAVASARGSGPGGVVVIAVARPRPTKHPRLVLGPGRALVDTLVSRDILRSGAGDALAQGLRVIASRSSGSGSGSRSCAKGEKKEILQQHCE
jgi:hypothetical protein